MGTQLVVINTITTISYQRLGEFQDLGQFKAAQCS